MPVKLKNIISIMEQIAPPWLALDGDNSGLLIGDEESDISSMLVSLDIDDDVCSEAVDKDVDLIITHHPVIYHPIKNINTEYPKGRALHKLISNNINVYSSHTNLDAADDGINSYLASKLALHDVSLLEETYSEEIYKLAVYVPHGFEDRVRKAMTDAGAGGTGNYGCCTFNMGGEGTFLPLQGSSPFIGHIGEMEHVNETKIETMALKANLNKVVDAMLKAHPYEEVAYDVYTLKNGAKKYGIGRVGFFDSPLSLRRLSENVKYMLGIDSVSVVGNPDRMVYKAAVCSGDGSDFIKRADNMGCDVYITGDIGYHDACDARDMGLSIIDAGHFATENVFMGELVRLLKNYFNDAEYNLNVLLSDRAKSPFTRV